jgi:hypothetical protein
MTEENQTNEDNFEISFRVLGNEFFGMKISSQSKAKNWAFFGVLTLVAVSLIVNEIGPAFVAMFNSIQ